jgi:large subunit ribosomal protein L1
MLNYCVRALSKLHLHQVHNCTTKYLHITSYNFAARKGTREKARKKKVKVETQKIGFIPHNQRGKDKLELNKYDKHVDDSWKAVSTDNVWVGRYYKWKVYSIEEAIESHRETHHPTMYNVPDAPLNVEIEVNMQAEKNKFLDNVQKMAMIPHKFDHGENRKILVFTKGQDIINEASSAGATLAGGPELLKDIQNGELSLVDYQYFIAHPNILPELVSIRGLMKKKFPNVKSGTLGSNIGELVTKFCNGIQYSLVKDEYQQNFGLINTNIGTLTMSNQQLKENLISLLEDVNSLRPKREGKFITRVLLKSHPSPEQFKINPFIFIPEDYVTETKESKKRQSKIENENIVEYAINN